MFEAIAGLKKIETINLGSESHYDSKKCVHILKLSTNDLKIPEGYIRYGMEIFDKGLETKICRLEFPPLNDPKM